jgi:hypothetical protein
MLTIQAAPAPASNPAAASQTSLALRSNRIAANPYMPAGEAACRVPLRPGQAAL